MNYRKRERKKKRGEKAEWKKKKRKTEEKKSGKRKNGARKEERKRKIVWYVTSSMIESGPSRSLVPTCILSVSRPRIASKSGAEFWDRWWEYEKEVGGGEYEKEKKVQNYWHFISKQLYTSLRISSSSSWQLNGSVIEEEEEAKTLPLYSLFTADKLAPTKLDFCS